MKKPYNNIDKSGKILFNFIYRLQHCICRRRGGHTMRYEIQLKFLRSACQKCHLNTLFFDPLHRPDPMLDLEFRRQIGLTADYDNLFGNIFRLMKPNTVYKVTDPFLCSYVFFLLPETDPAAVFSVGPYLAVEATQQQLLEQGEHAGLPPSRFRQLLTYYSAVPVLLEQSAIFSLLDAFFETLWGSGDGAYTLVDINRELNDVSSLSSSVEESPSSDEVLYRMRTLEARYAYEQELMDAVSRGLTSKAEVLFSSLIGSNAFEQRSADPIRNLKNYCIIMNTLMRKAAQQGGVHPIHLDAISSSFAHRIEVLPSTKACQDLMSEMFHAYCRLVNKHSGKNYSPLIQKAVIFIESDLSADLSLKNLSSLLNISASYLSTLFKKETGITITEYVNRKRIRHAAHLLATTHLQVQSIALHCGIPDVNYFSKLFKKHLGRSPKDYRSELRPAASDPDKLQ